MDASFKTCMFGGFDRQDVVAFIEKTAEEHRVETETLRAENEQLRRERDAAVAENEALRCLTEEDARLQEDNNRLQRRVEELQGKLAEVQAENDTLRGPAGEYQSLKEHIADIEISAHRRTEEFRARAMERRDISLEDQIFRAYGLCANARRMPIGEFMAHWSSLRLGAALGLLPLTTAQCDALLTAAQPAHVECSAGRRLTAQEQDEERSRVIRGAIQGG